MEKLCLKILFLNITKKDIEYMIDYDFCMVYRKIESLYYFDC